MNSGALKHFQLLASVHTPQHGHEHVHLKHLLPSPHQPRATLCIMRDGQLRFLSLSCTRDHFLALGKFKISTNEKTKSETS